MRVGILTLFHGNNNWGGDLQGYALKAYIEDNFKDNRFMGDSIFYCNNIDMHDCCGCMWFVCSAVFISGKV